MKHLGFTVVAGTLLFSVGVHSSAAEDVDLRQKVDALFASYDRRDSPGCALAVIQNGATLYERGYGTASLESNVAITPHTVFDIGSAAKQFTATSVLLLAENGKLSLDDDVRKFVQELPDYGAKVTLRHLLHHTSGLPDYIDLLRLAGARTEDVVTDEEALHLLALQKRLEFAPGSEHVYSNSGYFLLSLIVRQASGQPLRDLARERIFSPLAMRETQYVHDHTEIVPRRATGYAVRKTGGFRLASSNWEQNGDGGLLTTVEDLARWDQNFYEPRVGSRALVDLLQTPGVLTSGEALSYAMGLRVDRYRGLKRVGHNGSWAGFRAALWRFPEERFSVALLCNLASANAGRLASQVTDVYLEEKLEPPSAAAPTPPADKLIPVERAADYVGLYWEQESDDVVSVSWRDGRLELGREGDPTHELLMIAADRFQAKQGDLGVYFRSAEKARPDMVVTQSLQKPTVYVHVDAWKPNPSDLSAFSGFYWCAELESAYRFVASGSELVLLSRNGRSEVVKPVFRDTFESDLAGLIHFRRDGSTVPGFEVLSGRTRLSFSRPSSPPR
jgi:CubicO group peptidase (beta-lactamase class C family)